VYDEKVLLEMTLYGLPFIRVRVPNPFSLSDPPFGRGFDQQPRPIPDEIVRQNVARFTRIITVETDFTEANFGGNRVPRVTASVRDSFRPGETIRIPAFDQTALGSPVLPTAIYDLSLQPNPGASAGQEPELRGVRLVRALTSAPEPGYNPHVTTIVTDEVYAGQEDDTDLFVKGVWLPETPYTHQRLTRKAPGGEEYTDLLAMTLAQFRATSEEQGELRRFQRMVFEVSYLDPLHATAAQQQDVLPPLVQDIDVTFAPALGANSIQAAAQVQVRATVSDEGGELDKVSMTYTTDGVNWQQAGLVAGAGGVFTSPPFELPSGPAQLFVIVEAVDTAGNVTVETAKGQAQLLHLALPVTLR
jgi:hypothetical protein